MLRYIVNTLLHCFWLFPQPAKGKLIKLSVKATQNENAEKFPLSVKDEEGAAGDFYYAFVKLNRFEAEPDFWIIPSEIVCSLIRTAHRRWLQTPRRNGKPHKDTTMRSLPIKVTKSETSLYLENWDEDVKKYYKNLDQLV
jgi:hypothetical protein